MKQFLGLVAVLVITSGCGGSSSGGPASSLQKLNGNEYVVVSGNLKSEDALVQGTGKLVFRNPLVEEDNNYTLNFSLDKQGMACVISQTDRNLQDEVRFCFSRNDDGSLKAELKAGSELFDVSKDFAGVSAENALSASIDIHGHGHLIVWLLDKEFEYAFAKQPGTLWGLELLNATVTVAQQGPPKEAH